MIVEFDAFDRFEELSIVLTQPASHYDARTGLLTHTIGNLDTTSDEEFVCNWNELSEFNLRVWDYRHVDELKDFQAHHIYEQVELMRLLFVHNIGYFQIQDCRTGWDEHGRCYKDLNCKSIECELANRNIPFMPNGTFKMKEILEGGTWTNMTGSSNTQDPFDGLYSRMADWKLEYIDESLIDEYRTFEDVDTTKSVYQFLIEDIQEAFECFVIFDIIHRKFSIYKKEDYQQHTSIHLSRNDIIKDMEINRSSADVYTCINVTSEDETTMISAINPTVDNRMYDFTYYLDWMTPSLGEKVKKWQEDVDAAREEYAAFSLDFYEQMTIVLEAQQEAKRLESLYMQYEQMRCNLVAELSQMSNEDKQRDAKASRLLSYNNAIKKLNGEEVPAGLSFQDTCTRANVLARQTKDKLAEAANKRDKENEVYESFLKKQQKYRDTYNIQCYFTEEEYEELSHYIFEGSYSDPYTSTLSYMVYRERFKQMELLYERALKHLKEVARPKLEYEISTESFIFDSKFREWSEQLVTGKLINIEVEDGDVVELVLNNMTVNYDDKTISLTFGDAFHKFDPRSLFVNALGSIRKTTNTIGTLRELTSPFKDGRYNEMAEALQRSRDLTMDEVLHSYNEEVIIDEFGFTGRRLDGNTYDPRQVKIISKNIVFTNDGWQSCKMALGEIQIGGGETYYGLNAEVIVGDLILGNHLKIKDNHGNDLLDVMDGRITAQVLNQDSLLGSRLVMLENKITTSVESTQKEWVTFKRDVLNDVGEKVGELEEEVEGIANYQSTMEQTDKQIMLQVMRTFNQTSGVSDYNTLNQVKTAFLRLDFDKLKSAIRMEADKITWKSDQTVMTDNGEFYSIKINDQTKLPDGYLMIQGGFLDGVSGDTHEHSYIFMRSSIRDVDYNGEKYGISDSGGSGTVAWRKAIYLESPAVCIGAERFGVCAHFQGKNNYNGKYYWGIDGTVNGVTYVHGLAVKSGGSGSTGSSSSNIGAKTYKNGYITTLETNEFGQVTNAGMENFGIGGTGTWYGPFCIRHGVVTNYSSSSWPSSGGGSGVTGYYRFKDGEGYWNGMKIVDGCISGFKWSSSSSAIKAVSGITNGVGY